MPSAGLSETLADVSLKARIPAMSQGLTYELIQKEVTFPSHVLAVGLSPPEAEVTTQTPSQPFASDWIMSS